MTVAMVRVVSETKLPTMPALLSQTQTAEGSWPGAALAHVSKERNVTSTCTCM